MPASRWRARLNRVSKLSRSRLEDATNKSLCLTMTAPAPPSCDCACLSSSHTAHPIPPQFPGPSCLISPTSTAQRRSTMLLKRAEPPSFADNLVLRQAREGSQTPALITALRSANVPDTSKYPILPTPQCLIAHRNMVPGNSPVVSGTDPSNYPVIQDRIGP